MVQSLQTTIPLDLLISEATKPILLIFKFLSSSLNPNSLLKNVLTSSPSNNVIGIFSFSLDNNPLAIVDLLPDNPVKNNVNP